MTGSPASLDVITMGRVGVDLYPLQSGVGLDEVESFGRFLGGSATNVAVAAARYGRRAAVITRTGADPFGGALCHGLLSGWDLARTFAFANAAGAVVASRLACAAAMPEHGEVAALLDGVPA